MNKSLLGEQVVREFLEERMTRTKSRRHRSTMETVRQVGTRDLAEREGEGHLMQSLV